MPPRTPRTGLQCSHLSALTLALLLAALVTVVPPGVAPVAAAPTAAVPLKVMTLDIFYGGDDLNPDNGQFCLRADGCPDTLVKVIDAIRTAAPDVVGLEEGEHSTRAIAEALGWHHSERMQIVSRLPLIDPPGGDGVYLFVQLAPGKVAALMNVHLPAEPYGPCLVRDGGTAAEVRALEESVRLPAIAAQLRALPALKRAGIPVFLVGDFNSPSHLDWTAAVAAVRPEVRFPFHWPVSRALAAAGFRDGYRVVHPDPVEVPGFTWTPGGPETVRNEIPDRIDWVLASGKAVPRSATLLGEPGHPDVGIAVGPYPTDHRGVMVGFDVTPGNAPIMVAAGSRRVSVGDTLPVVFHARGRSGERVAIVPAGGAAGAALQSRATGGAADGTATFATASLAPGAYEAALLDAGGAIVSRSPFWLYAPDAPAQATTAAPATGPGKPPVLAAPARPGGVKRSIVEPAEAGDPRAAIREFRNAAGQTVYAMQAVRFDVSPPLRELAILPVPEPEGEEEQESSIPLLPRWRIPRSTVPDPVVQRDFVTAEAMQASRTPFPVAAPATGFSFEGVGQFGAVPSDSNGSVGNDQYVMTVNSRYQVWSLDRGLKAATSLLGPANINTLWAGFGGPCQTQNAGDPIVIFDKLANRWLISQFTTSVSGGFYYQCVAVSTTADATGAYGRWAFPVPGGAFGDYPHFGAWTDAYYMMAHAFASSGGGGYVGGLFAAMDRAKMLVADPTATWQVIIDPTEGGHMPADLDGFAPPPSGAPGIFLSLHGPAMYFYRMDVDFAAPANTTRTLQGTAPIAPATGACALAPSPGTCIPQPGTLTRLDSLGDRLMFRAAYRNFVDHESIVVSHSVDPSITGVQSGVRWYDFRLSGSPDATCATYPCTFQQGTIADDENGRSRWMPSIAMDGAENILVGYSTSGKTNLTENHSIRYTGRAFGDPPNTMTAPESTIATGIRNNSGNSRWGDYTSMSVDPFDDCTFWFTNQYYPVSTNVWSTRVGSVSYPPGGGPGECQPSTCTERPVAAPSIDGVAVTGDNQLQVTWGGVLPAPGSYAIERAAGACGSEGPYQPLAAVGGGQTSYTDTTVQGGIVYSYRVVAAADAAGRCQALVASPCATGTATGTCNLKPAFAGVKSATSRNQSNCGVQISWDEATAACPLTPSMRYNIFRGTTPDFTPSPANRIATCAPGPDGYVDTDNLASGVTYYYVVRAEDASAGNGGECAGGNEESNSVVVSGTAYGPGAQPAPGTWVDGGGDGTAFLQLNLTGSGETAGQAWRFVKTSDDAGANHTPGGSFAYRNAGPTPAHSYFPDTCATLQTPTLTVGSNGTVNLNYWERHQVEYHWDGVVIEYRVNFDEWSTVPAPSDSPAAGCAATDTITNWETLGCTGAPPANACGYTSLQPAINGPLAGGTSCSNWSTGPIGAYAHRCHPIPGLSAGDTITFRWRFTSDPGAEFAGFYLDDIEIGNVSLPNACVPDLCAGQPDGAACTDGDACTGGEVCGSGACGGGVPLVAAPINDSVVFDAAGTTISWSDPPGDYNVYRSTRMDGAPWAYDQACFDSHTALSSSSDASIPPPGGVFYYYVARVDACSESGIGTDSAGNPRPNPTPCP